MSKICKFAQYEMLYVQAEKPCLIVLLARLTLVEAASVASATTHPDSSTSVTASSTALGSTPATSAATTHHILTSKLEFRPLIKTITKSESKECQTFQDFLKFHKFGLRTTRWR